MVRDFSRRMFGLEFILEMIGLLRTSGPIGSLSTVRATGFGHPYPSLRSEHLLLIFQQVPKIAAAASRFHEILSC